MEKSKPVFDILCLTHNSEKTLPLMFSSLSEFSSRQGRIIICDTGSTDGSVALARSMGAHVAEAGEQFVHTIDAATAAAINERFVVEGEEPIVKDGSRYFHFAEARNFCLSLAVNDWVAWIDSDEAFVRLDIDKLNEVMANPDISLIEYLFAYAWNRPPDLSNPNDLGVPGLEFVQAKTFRHLRMNWGILPVHELVTPLDNPAPGGLGNFLLPKESFYLGHWQQAADHRSNYLVGLGASCFKIPTSDRNAHNLAREMMYHGRPKSAIKEFQRHIAMGGWPAERAESWALMGDCFGQIGEHDQQVEAYFRCFHLDPTRRVGLLRLAHHYRQVNQPVACAAFASAAMEIPHHPFYATDMREFGAIPYALRYWARGWSGNIAGAQQDIMAALSFEPENPEYVRDLKFYFGYDPEKAPEGYMLPSELVWLHDNAQGKKRILEVGSWKGRSTHALCTGAAKSGTVYAVDHFGGSSEVGDWTHGADADEIFRQFTSNTAQFENLIVRRADSLEAVKDFPEGYFDAAFVDATHDFEHVRSDILAWRSKVKGGGLLCGHDFQLGWPGVCAAVRAVVGDPDGVSGAIWWKKVPPRDTQPLLSYLTSMVREGKPASFVKLGDGEQACMDGEKGANCDGHPYSEPLAWKLKMAFSALEKMTAPREGRTWVNVVPFSDQPYFNCLLHRNTNSLDDVKAFWAAVRESDKLKVFVGPRRLEPVAGMLKALFVEVPLVNAFSEYDAIREKLTWHAKAGTIFVFSAGFVSKVLIANLLQRTQEISCIDAGSCWDPLVVGPTRTEQLPKWLLEHEYREWMEGGDAK